MSAPVQPERLSEQQRAAVRRTLRYTARTASAASVQYVAEAVDQARGAEPQTPGWRGGVEVLVEQTGPVLRRLLDAEAEVERLRAVEANARKLVSAWLRASAEHISISNLDAVRDTPLIAGMQDGRANQYSDCANELRDVLDGEDPDGFEFGVSVQVTAESEDALAEREFAAEAGHGAPEPGDGVVAHRAPGAGLLFCLACHPVAGLYAPVTSEDLPDGGVCAGCGRDVLIPRNAEAGEQS